MTDSRRGKPITERNYDAFLSHAHVDKPTIVQDFYDWCKDHADLRIWYDASQLHTGNISPQLGEAIADSQAGIVILTKASIERNFVAKEVSLFEMQQGAFRDFKIIIIQAEDCYVPDYLASLYRIDISATGFDGLAAVKLLGALHRHQSSPETLRRPPVYLARGSRPIEVEKAAKVTDAMRKAGYRIIRDFPQADMDLDRLRRLIRGSVGVVALAPHRPTEMRTTSEGVMDEIRIALDENVPLWLVVDQGLDPALLPTGLESKAPVVRISDSELTDVTKLNSYAEHFREELRRRGQRRGAHCFFGHIFRGKSTRSVYERARQCVESISGLPCYSGDELYGTMMLPEIVRRITEAEFCIFDISNEEGSNALNTCIEAGVAMGAAQAKNASGEKSALFADLHIIARGPRREPPFMFQAVQVSYYDSELELIGLLRKICVRYRRIAE